MSDAMNLFGIFAILCVVIGLLVCVCFHFCCKQENTEEGVRVRKYSGYRVAVSNRLFKVGLFIYQDCYTSGWIIYHVINFSNHFQKSINLIFRAVFFGAIENFHVFIANLLKWVRWHATKKRVLNVEECLHVGKKKLKNTKKV